ncbi:MAG: 6-bladed beta-propeller [Thermodesulfobacteriota bacterium]
MRLYPLILLVAVLLLSGCASTQWRYELTDKAELTWPAAPKRAKVVYVGALHRFSPEGWSLASLLLGKGDAGLIQEPVSVAVGLDGRIAIAEAGKQGVHLYIPAKQKYVLLFKGKEPFASPVSVMFDTSLRLYVADSAGRKVVIFDEAGAFAGELHPRQEEFGGPKPEEFGRPTGIAYGNGLLYVSDATRHLVHIFDSQNRYLRSIGGNGTADGQFNMPTHLATDSNGMLYVNDAMNFRIQVLDSDMTFMTRFGRHGDGSGDFAMSKGVAVDDTGAVYVVDALFDAVQVFDPQKNFALTIGGQGSGPGQFWLPSGIFIDHANRLYVCDRYNNRVQVFQVIDFQPE